MRRVVPALLVGLALIYAAPASAQSAAASARTTQVVARFSKHKHVVKESHGVRREKYKDMRGEPAILPRLSDYAGTYDNDFGFTLHLAVDTYGNLSGAGAEPLSNDAGVGRSFVLADAKLDGALFTATKVYASGRRDRLEGVFMNLTSRNAPADAGVTTFGLGVITAPTTIDGLTVERLFYARSAER